MKPKVFLGSSTESKPLAEALQVQLEPETECQVWHQGVFELSKSFLGNLTDKVDRFDFAVFIFAPDDVITRRGQEQLGARDNVIFEMGLFTGAIGRDRTFLLVPRDAPDLHLPSDLLGITAAEYDLARFRSEGRSALGSASTLIKEKINRLGARQHAFFEKADIGPQEIEDCFRRTGLSYVYRAREESREKMLSDMRQAKTAIAMYARVYISELIKDFRGFSESIAAAVERRDNSQTPELVVSHTSTDYRDDALVEQIWAQEDPGHEEWSSLEDYQRHLKRSDVKFSQLHKHLSEMLASSRAARRKRVRFKRSYLSRCVLPYSLLVIDESIVYVSFYSLSKGRFGTFAPTMRLVCSSGSCDTWAQSFLAEKNDIDLNYSIPGPVLPLI